MNVAYHLSPSRNRPSIATHGLDWRRMGGAPGIAGNRRPDIDGVYLTEADSIAFFLGFGRPLDVWRVDVTDLELEDGPDGWLVHRAPIPPERLTLFVAGDEALPWTNDRDADVRAERERLRDALVRLIEAGVDVAYDLERLDHDDGH